ncbi:AMP-binding enzyme [Necator americanus]|uniref:AMP-binding enzyme n=1 Tax=Necator americanus TaxID=51031 RepID=W2T3B2_NECAM|nr:AMP-binding enzyme [Necator americanus]ETN75721.1 AMP-binding enzyme [Necator americanus]
MACLQLGAIYIPVNPSYTRSETEHYVKDSTPKLMVTCDEEKDKVFQDRIDNVQHELRLSKQSQTAEVVLDVENVESNDVACVCYTSGTTGSLTLLFVLSSYSRLLSTPRFTRDCLPNVRLFVSGSAPLSNPVWEEFKSRTGHAILERYGMTEAQVICSNPYDDRRPGSVGKPIGDTKLRINKEGGIEIQSSSLFAGYWKNPTKTAQEFTSDNYFITGDVGALDKDGFLRIHGRAKDLIITGGFNVYPKEIEDCIDRLPDVSESAIIDLGEVPVAVVCMNADKSFDEKEVEQKIITALKEVVAKYKVPKHVVFLPNLPRNSMAKIQKNILRDQYKHLCDKK